MSLNEALLLIGHGSARYPHAADAMHLHAERLRETGRFSQVEAAVLNGPPSVQAVLGRIAAPIRVVPFFMEDGYFSQVAVPASLSGRAAVIGRPVGVHDGMAGLIERQALAACDNLGIASREAAVLVVGHGSSRTPGRAAALHRHTSRVAATDLFVRVEAACLEEPPFVADALHRLRAHPVVVIGFFANQGAHVSDDLPALIAAAREDRGRTGLPVQFLGPVTEDPMLVQIILDQAINDTKGG